MSAAQRPKRSHASSASGSGAGRASISLPEKLPAGANPTVTGFAHTSLVAAHVAPNILSVRHWDRLLGGLLYAASPRVDWATLLRRTFDVDVLQCTACGGRLRVLGEIAEPEMVRLMLDRLGFPAEAPHVARARDPTELLGQTEES